MNELFAPALAAVSSAVAAAAVAAVATFLALRRRLAAADARADEAEMAAAGARARYEASKDEIDRIREDAASDLARQKGQYDEQSAVLRDSLREMEGRLSDAREQIAGLRADAAAAAEKHASDESRIRQLQEHYERTQKLAEDRFRQLSEQILRERSQELQSKGLDGIRGLMDELRKDFQAFKDRVDKVNTEDEGRVSSLRTTIEDLLRQTNSVSAQANHLADAIRGDAQLTGQWGEIQLRRVLEAAGLRETLDYTFQETFRSPDAVHRNLRTDVLVKLPGDRWLVIDAKTTLASFDDFRNAGDDAARRQAADRIAASVKAHVDEIKRADYARSIGMTTGKKLHAQVLMFIPVEEVYLVAMKARMKGGERLLRDYAWENGVVFMDASGLLPVLRLVAEFWAQENSSRNAARMKEAAEGLLDKAAVFLDGFEELGKSLSTAVQHYNESCKRLSGGPGNIVRRLREMGGLGVSAAARIPTEEGIATRMIGTDVETPRPLS